jgi:hypothetical protein
MPARVIFFRRRVPGHSETTGKKLFQQSFLNTTTITTSQLAKGIYFYEISSKDRMVKKGKLMKNSTL